MRTVCAAGVCRWKRSGQDVRFGLRSLAKSSGFTLTLVITLALGIGANTAMFSVINGLFLRPLAVKKPEKLVVLTTELPGSAGSAQLSNFSYPDYRDLREQADAFTGFAAYELGLVGLSTNGR